VPEIAASIRPDDAGKLSNLSGTTLVEDESALLLFTCCGTHAVIARRSMNVTATKRSARHIVIKHPCRFKADSNFLFQDKAIEAFLLAPTRPGASRAARA
jgi:hypothetical protein